MHGSGFERETSFFRSHFDLIKNIVDRYRLEDGYVIVPMKTDSEFHRVLKKEGKLLITDQCGFPKTS